MGKGDFEAEMNIRLLHVLLVIQLIFAGSLFYIGNRVRETRKSNYLEITHRITSGCGNEDDFLKLAGTLPPVSRTQDVRSLFGLPVQMADKLIVTDPEEKILKGRFWLYYLVDSSIDTIDANSVLKLNGRVRTFVISVNAQGCVRGRIMWVMHPL